jgi:head-tail adaptor
MDPLYIQPGELRHKVTIVAPARTPDSRGLSITPNTWNTVLTTRAKIDSAGGRAYKESFANGAFASVSSDFITIRWPGASITIEPGMRVLFGDNIYQIQAVDNVLHRNRKVNLACIMVDEDSN